MVKTIYKFVVPLGSEYTRIYIPKDANVLHVGEQGGSHPVMWVELDPSKPFVFREFIVHGTGHKICSCDAYHGTAFIGPYVWHVYERVVV